MIWLILAIITCTWVIVLTQKNKAQSEQNVVGQVASTRYIQSQHEWLSWLENSQYKMRGDIIKLLGNSSLANKQKLEQLRLIIKGHNKAYEDKVESLHKEQDVFLAEAHARGFHPENEEINRADNKNEQWWKEESAELRKVVKPFLSKLDLEEVRSLSIL